MHIVSGITRCLLLLTALSLSAGAASAQQVRGGLAFGLSRSAANYHPELQEWTVEARVLPDVLLFTELVFSQRLRLHTGLRFFMRGNDVWYNGHHSPSGPPTLGSLYRLTQYYLAVPLRARVSIPQTPLFVEAGPEVAFLAAAVSYNNYPHRKRNLRDHFQPVNLAGGLGVGARFCVLHQAFHVLLSIRKTVTEEINHDAQQIDFSSKEVTLSVGYRFY